MTWPWQVHLDRKTCLAGVYSDPNTTWTLPFTDDTIDCIVLGDDFGAIAGTILTPDSNNGTDVVIAGDYSAGCAMLGRLYAMSIEITRPFRMQMSETGEPVADLDVWTTIREIVASYTESGPFTIRVTYPYGPDRTKTFTQVDGVITDDTVRYIKAIYEGNAEDMRIFIESTSAKPVVVNSIDIELDHEARKGDR